MSKKTGLGACGNCPPDDGIVNHNRLCSAPACMPKPKSELAQSKGHIRKLLSALTQYSEANFMDDDEEKERVAPKVDKAMREARIFLSKRKA